MEQGEGLVRATVNVVESDFRFARYRRGACMETLPMQRHKK